ncbi:uncharacterized protein [Nicotiana tomentosiformis]|uniref:uncharacterized protein n=1 Tax=Nicotiana tomentosiformis TaxID=4098 RepID=UPI00388C9FC8
MGGMPQQSSCAMVPASVAPPPAQPAGGRGQAIRGGGQAVRGGGQPARGHPRDVVHSGRAQHRCYAFLPRQEAESSNAVITGIVPVSSYFASYLVVPCDSLTALVYVSMPVGDSIIVYRVYRSCVITIGSLKTSVDPLLLDMIDFDIIMGMDWLSPYHAILECHSKTVTLSMMGLPRFEWRGTPGHSTSRVISYMKTRRIVKKGCLAYLAYVCDSSAEVPSMDSVPVVREFPKV